MNEFIYIIGLLVASYIAWRFGSQQKQDAIEGLQEEIQESRRLVKQAEKHAESMSIMNHGLSREIMQLTKALREHERNVGKSWEYAGMSVTSIGEVTYRDKRYLVMEPSGKGFTPFVVQAENPKLFVVTSE